MPEAGGSPFLGRNIASTYAARGTAVLVSFVLFPIVARHVGLTMFGLWLFVNSFTVFFALDFGMSTALVRYVAEAHARGDEEQMSRYASSVLALLSVIGLVGSVGLAVAVALFSPALEVPSGHGPVLAFMTAAIVGSTLLVSLPLSAFRTVIAGVQRYDVANGLILLQAGARVLAVLAVVRADLGIMGVVMAEATVTVGSAMVGVVLCRRLVPNLKMGWRHIDGDALRHMAPFAFRVFVMNLSAVVILQTDNLVIGAVLSAASVALYGGAFRLYLVCRELTNCLTAPLIPDASRRNAQGSGLAGMFVLGTRCANALMIVICVPMALFAREVLVAWAGSEFASVDTVLHVLLVGLVLNNNHLVAASLLTGMGAVGRYTRYHVVWALANLTLSIILAPRFGLVGVALGTTLPLVVLEPLYVRTALRTFGVAWRSFFVSAIVRVLAPACLAAAPLLLVLKTWPGHHFLYVASWSAAWTALFLAAFARFGMSSVERRSLVQLFFRAGGVRSSL